MAEKKNRLLPKHFKPGLLRMGERGLEFDMTVGLEERLDYCDAWDRTGGLAERMRSTYQGSPTRVVLNPNWLTPQALLNEMTSSQKPGVVEAQPSYALENIGSFQTDWCEKPATYVDAPYSESQSTTLVAFAPEGRVLGFCSMGTSLDFQDDSKSIELWIEATLTYVTAHSRGKGHGIDLAYAAGAFQAELLNAAYRAAPRGWSLGAAMVADYESEGGERFTRYVQATLEKALFSLMACGSKSSIDVATRVQLSAGY